MRVLLVTSMLFALTMGSRATAINVDMSLGTGITSGQAYHGSADPTFKPQKMIYLAQHYVVGVTNALLEQISLNYDVDFVVLYGSGDSSQVIRYGGAVTQTYHLFGASRAKFKGSDFLSITEKNNYNVSIQLQERLHRYDANFDEGRQKIDGTTLSVLIGFEVRVPLSNNTGLGLSQNSTIANLPFGSELLRSQEKQTTLFYSMLW